ncbi:hypothetical protein SASPL_157804 [Salvia splendens]|uniref:Solute carrier family 39 (Zinc transporter), member 1/2/3 n=1 Tax=Salvia splendens TaxID=180675 RepID=A0A8X8YTP4_SALSN|nr:hypothetical protein SASPL_157804 [Salvia splendens]
MKTHLLAAIIIALQPAAVLADCTCEAEDEYRDKALALRYKLAALASILVASAAGVCLPVVAKWFPALSPKSNLFFVVKAFAAGVILSTGFIHVLPDAFESLTSPCFPKSIDNKALDCCTDFHQFFEGIGLGGCISQAMYNVGAIVTMAGFFSLTTPVGIAIGIGIANIYSETSSTALIVEGVFNSASAGILIYMALVDLLSADFMSPRLQNNGKLQLGANLALLIGAGCMSLLAKWA